MGSIGGLAWKNWELSLEVLNSLSFLRKSSEDLPSSMSTVVYWDCLMMLEVMAGKLLKLEAL